VKSLEKFILSLLTFSKTIPLTSLLKHYLIFNGVNSHLRSIGQFEKDLLSMIQHWEAAAGKTVSDSELLALKKLCKGRNLLQHLGYGPLIKQKKPISKWLSSAKSKIVIKEKVQEVRKQFEGKEKLNALFFLIGFRADVLHGLILKVIQLLDKISKNEEQSNNIYDGKFDDINMRILILIEQDSEVKNFAEELEASKNLEDDITSLMLKTSDKSSSEMFWVSDCATCGYKFDPKK
jgi:hypothetical protein